VESRSVLSGAGRSTASRGFIGAVEEQQAVWTTEARNLRFTQDSISARFQDGRSVSGLIEDVKVGRVSTAEIKPIRIFERDGKIFSLDNRRLYVFQEAGVPARVRWATPAEVAKEAPFKMTTTNGGASIVIRP
jgi:hypothetical protein